MTATATEGAQPSPGPCRRPPLLAAGAGSVGVVFGDIGTSPLYAFRSALATRPGEACSARSVLGVVSLALWALILVVTVKYVLFLMRADNKGEGGVLSLMALAQRAIGRRTHADLLPGRDRRGAVLRRRDDHAGDLGALGGRGPAHRARRWRATSPPAW